MFKQYWQVGLEWVVYIVCLWIWLLSDALEQFEVTLTVCFWGLSIFLRWIQSVFAPSIVLHLKLILIIKMDFYKYDSFVLVLQFTEYDYFVFCLCDHVVFVILCRPWCFDVSIMLVHYHKKISWQKQKQATKMNSNFYNRRIQGFFSSHLLTTQTRVRSSQGKLEKSGEIRKRFAVTRKSGNVDCSPVVMECQGIWKFLGRKSKMSTKSIILWSRKWWSLGDDQGALIVIQSNYRNCLKLLIPQNLSWDTKC